MSEQEERVTEEVKDLEPQEEQPQQEEPQGEDNQEEKETFWKKMQKPVSGLVGWLIFGGFIVFIVVLGLIILLNVK
jgi:hypothetical protein